MSLSIKARENWEILAYLGDDRVGSEVRGPTPDAGFIILRHMTEQIKSKLQEEMNLL
jgi:hypothetical protein